MRDPIVDLHAQAVAHEAASGDVALSAAESRAAYSRLRAAQEAAFPLRAATPAGALASLEWARHQFAVTHVEDERDADWHDRFVLGLLDGALGVMRGMVTGAKRTGAPLPDVEDAVLDLRCDLSVIEALIPGVMPEEDAADRLGVPRQRYYQVALIPEDSRRAMLRAVDTLRVNMGTLSRASGVGDMIA